MIKVNNISYTIDGKNILSNINLNITRNKITVITGKNGSGKSSLIKIINKIIIPDKGTINSEYSEPIPMLFQKPISLNIFRSKNKAQPVTNFIFEYLDLFLKSM